MINRVPYDHLSSEAMELHSQKAFPISLMTFDSTFVAKAEHTGQVEEAPKSQPRLSIKRRAPIACRR